MTKTKTTIFAIILTSATIGLLASTVSFSNAANAQEVSVPNWIQNIAGFWSSGDVSDGEFVNAMTFLVEEGIMDLPNVLSPAEAQTITSSLEEMDQRLEKVESQQTTTGTIAPTPAIPEEPPEDTTYPYVFAVCPSDKIRHFEKVWFETTAYYSPPSGLGLDPITSISAGIIVLEDSEEDLKYAFDMRQRGANRLHQLGYADGEVDFNQITIIDIEHAVICANKPGMSGSGDSLGFE